MAAKIPPVVSKWFDVGVSVGAAVVIFGALQKLLHTSYADTMLKVGLTTESLIFLGYGVLYMIYPYLDDHEMHVPELEGAKKLSSPVSQMDEMMANAGLSSETFSRLNDNFGKLHTTVSRIGELDDVINSTTDFSAKTKEATTALQSVPGAVAHVTGSLESFSMASESTKHFHTQIQTLTKNLSSLNTIYELELQESNQHLKSLNQFYGNLAQASTTMNESAEDASKVKEQISSLADNLGKLNQVYGSMLNAMQSKH
jgi:gliding motility-associated protein GldL